MTSLRRIRLCILLLAALACANLAYAAETVLYEKQSPYNNIIVTETSEGMRVLRFERYGARQSIVKLGDPDYLGFGYTKVAFVGLALSEEPQRMLIVGLGGGTMPMFLRKHYPDATIDVVDIDPDVVAVAKEYFGFREDARLHAHVGDGRKFIEGVREAYDVIFLDAFGARNVPPPLTTIEFLNAVRHALKPTGVVIGNIWHRTANPLYDSMVRTYQEVFDELFILQVPGSSNRILLGLPRKHPFDRTQLTELARKTGANKHFPYDLGDVSEEQFTYASRKSKLGRVLRDAEPVQPAKAMAQ